MKIIGVDNYNRENVSDILIAENITNEYLGNKMVEVLNYGRLLTKDEKEKIFHKINLISDTYYKLETNNYKLYEFVY